MTHEANSENASNYWEIIDKNPYLKKFLKSVKKAEELINSPECDDGDARDILTTLENGWLYQGTVAGIIGKVRPYDGDYQLPDVESHEDEMGQYALVDGSDEDELFRFVNIEAVTDASGYDRIAFGVTDAMMDPTIPLYLVLPDEVLRWKFNEKLPEVRAHILHHLEPELLNEIDAMIVQPLDSPDGLRKLSLVISPTKYGDYDIVEEIEAYINHATQYDREYPSILTLKGIVMNEEGEVGTIANPSDIQATLGNLSLITTQEVGKPPVQKVMMSARVPHPIQGQDDEELTFLLEYLETVRSMRPTVSALGALAAGVTLDMPTNMPIEVTHELATPFNNNDEEIEDRYIQRRHVQSCIDHAIQYVQATASAYCSDEETAYALARTCQATCEEIIGQELLGFTFVVEGTGVESSQYTANGFAAPGEIHFELAHVAPSSPDPFVDCQYVVFQGLAVEVREDEGGYKVVPTLSARLVNHSNTYQLTNPVTSHMAAVVTKYDFCTVRLDGSAEITEIHLYDRKKFAKAMDYFSHKLIEAPDLEPVYAKLLEIEDQFITEDDELQPFAIEPFQEIGELCGGDELGSALASDALSELFGNERIVKINGRGFDTNADTPREFDNLVKISSIISTHRAVGVEEPMFAFEVVDGSDQSSAVHLLPLRDLTSIAI